MQQKVISLFLTATDTKIKHGEAEEHLAEYLDRGWRVVNMTAAGGHSAGAPTVRVFVVVVLERPSRDRTE